MKDYIKMHELSIVQSMMKIIEKHAKNREVERLVVKIGKMSGIEPYFLKESFDFFKEGTVCANAEMEIIEVNIKIKCFECGSESEIKGFDFHCPVCGSEKTKIISGEEMHIEYIELKE
ncbi:hydrogenase maturation nickel metallochaperone HypA [Lebetimonas natsushimae]|uniref:hydrogenase maturation nickel metallochaperone HypA/HybF n=1 Tax=Lebetimonas natsushimae TaxID=1936991 RepID=UPI001EE6F026|nr:hydrogenase maturation nickel metallochaperone HypA [Lebetimonas natsushimae]